VVGEVVGEGEGEVGDGAEVGDGVEELGVKCLLADRNRSGRA
jgi:hypothetical protein